jgi:hypothetical protein
MSELEIGFPETSESSDGDFMKPGLIRMKIDKIVEWKNSKTKEPMTDKRGYPGLEITLINESGEMIKDGFYYSKEPLKSPSRSDKNSKCKSEFLLMNLKKALGFGTEIVPPAQLKSKWCWGAIGTQVMVDSEGNPTGKDYSFLVKKFYPDGPKPAIIGDPDLPQSDGKASGIFYKETLAKGSVSSTSAVPDRAVTPSKAEGTDPLPNDDDMPVEDEF